MRPNRSVLGTALIAALVATFPLAAAAKPKQTLSAIVNGHRIRLKNKQIVGAIAGDGGISITGGTRIRHFGQTAKTLIVTCPSGPLAGGTLPAPAPGQLCTVGYMETKLSRHPNSKEWLAPFGGPTVTFTAFDGSRVQGTFEGTLDPLAGVTTPATVTTGKFNILLP